MRDTCCAVGIISEKDAESRITKCNDAFLYYGGFTSKDDILGKTDFEFPWQQYADLYRNHELDALSGKAYSTLIPLTDSHDNDLLFLHTKAPKKDNAGNIIGITCHALELFDPNAHALISLLKKTSISNIQAFKFSTLNQQLPLSKRQKEVVFLLVRGKKVKAIAKLLGLSVRTIRYYIELIKIKLNCHTLGELIDLALSAGFDAYLPSRISSEDLFKILHDE